MKAIVYNEFGPPEVLLLQEVQKPVPKDDEVLIRVYASPVSYGDLLARNFKNISASQFHMPLPLMLLSRLYFGINKPRVHILGSEFSGEIEAVGKNVTWFKVGDAVMGYLGQRMGAYAEYVCMSHHGTFALKPVNMTHAEAAAVPYGTLMAGSLLGHVNIQSGHKVLVNGASGGIGSAAVQLARYYGAEVTGVCGTQRMDYVKSLGAERVIDYTQEDFTQNGEKYDLILDVLGTRSFSDCRNSLKPNGVYLMASFKMKHLLQMLSTKLSGGQKMICTFASEKPEALVFIKELIEAGQFKSPIDRTFPLEQAAEAHRYVESGQKKGPVVLIVNQENHPL